MKVLERKTLKAIAKELKVAVIAISSLNQNGAKRQNKRPELGDLRGSGAIKFDATGNAKDSTITAIRIA